MIYRTDDPHADFERHDRAQAEYEKRLPKCSHCGYPIQEETFVLVDDIFLCEKCIAEHYTKHTEDYMK